MTQIIEAAPVEMHTLVWNGIRIEIRYCPNWLESYEGVYGYPLAHLEIDAIDPEGAPLPMTETGYRSHFTRPDLIAADGGPVAFARAWLDDSARDRKWIEREAERKQLSLF
ncbi:MAG: hypothetical protein WD688_25770 [Candidatus Binatia bacterium]